jgi:hypothetical protein
VSSASKEVRAVFIVNLQERRAEALRLRPIYEEYFKTYDVTKPAVRFGQAQHPPRRIETNDDVSRKKGVFGGRDFSPARRRV